MVLAIQMMIHLHKGTVQLVIFLKPSSQVFDNQKEM